MTLSNSLLYVPFISRPLHPKTPFSLFCSSNVSRSLRISFLLLLILNCHLPSQFFFFFLPTTSFPHHLFLAGYHTFSSALTPLLILSRLPLPFFPSSDRWFIISVWTENRGMELLSWWITTGIGRDTQREKARVGYWGSPPLQTVCLAGTWSLGLSARLSATVCFCLCQRSRPEPKFPHIMRSGWTRFGLLLLFLGLSAILRSV